MKTKSYHNLKHYFYCIFGIALLTQVSCTKYHFSPEDFGYYEISRVEIIEIANEYLLHEWWPTEKNVFHGYDIDDIRVDTPDNSFIPIDYPSGWWIPNEVNIGLPYMWGGFSSIEEFDQGIADGKYAGDIYTPDKRNHIASSRSNHAVGIDCSGFVSRCWKLPFHHSTRILPQISDLLPDVKELKPGDILNKHNVHVYLFDRFIDKEKTIINVYHSSTHKVKQEQFLIQYLIEDGFLPYRYKEITEQP